MNSLGLSTVMDLAVFGLLAFVVLATVGLFVTLIGSDYDPEATPGTRPWVLAVGLLLLAVGLGQVIQAVLSGGPLDGLTVAFVGLAALAYYVLRRRENADLGATDVERHDT